MLVGNRTPYKARHTPSEQELKMWNHIRSVLRGNAERGVTVADSLRAIRSPQWRWKS